MADISKIKLPSDNTVYNLKDASAVHSISGTSPISVSGTAISHVNSGVTAASKGDTTNQTPAFGGTVKALSATVNATGHLTALAEHTITIPSATATTTAAGLMSAADKVTLDDAVERIDNIEILLSNLVARIEELENHSIFDSDYVSITADSSIDYGEVTIAKLIERVERLESGSIFDSGYTAIEMPSASGVSF